MTSLTGRTLASRSRLAILRVLRRSSDPLLLTEVCEATGLHPNTAREHLDRLVAQGFVEREPERLGVRGRPRFRYRCALRPAAATADPRFREAFLQGAMVAGSAGWPSAGRQLAALELHLADLGFDPEPDGPASCVHLRACPYTRLAGEETDLMCEVHLGLVQDVLAQEDGPVVATALEPFVGPNHCLLHLERR